MFEHVVAEGVGTKCVLRQTGVVWRAAQSVTARGLGLGAGYALIHSDFILQQLAPDDVDYELTGLRHIGPWVVFRIATRYSVDIGIDGHNLTRCVRAPEWWQSRVAAVFGQAHMLSQTPKGMCTIITWAPDAALHAAFGRFTARMRRARTWDRRRERFNGRMRRLWWPLPDESRLYTALANKQVALVGNAESLAERDYGSQIDDADIVVRCNRGVIVDVRSHGRRTDWLCTALPISRAEAERRGVSRIIWASRRRMMIRNIPSWMMASRDFYLFSRERNEELREMFGKVASTGLKALDTLARSNCRSLSVFGFDFAQSASASDPTRPMSTDHDFDAERCYALDLAARDPRLTLYR